MNFTRRALHEAMADWRHEMRGRGLGAQALACLRMLTALLRLGWQACVSFEEPPFRHVGRDAVYAIRALWRSPGFTMFSVASLSAGLAATMAVCSLVVALFLTPLDVPHLDRLVNLDKPDTSKRGMSWKFFSWTEYLALERADAAFTSLAASGPFYRQTLAGLGTSEAVSGEVTNGDYFSTLGIVAPLGRVLQPSDDRSDAPPVVVISDRTWRVQFSADPAIVGKTVKIADASFIVAGVTPPSFHGTDPHSNTALWIPISAIQFIPSLSRNFPIAAEQQDQPWIDVRGLLRPGVSVDQASTIVAAIGHALDETTPKNSPASPPSTKRASATWYVVPTASVYNNERADRQVVPMAWGVMGLVGLVLLVACSNLANLALARGVGRRHELAVRLALGATRWRVMREQLVESACVTLLAVIPSFWAARALMTWTVQSLPFAQFNEVFFSSPGLDMTMATVAGVGAVTSFAVAGLWPSWQLTRTSVRGALASDSSSNAALPQWKGRARLIASQVVCSVALVFMAVVIGEQIVPIRPSDSGMRLDGLAVANLSYPRHLRDETGQRQTLDTLLERARQQPGITSASLVGRLEFSGGAEGVWVTAPDRPSVKGAPAPLVAATPDVFAVLGIPTRKGRTFDARDTREAPPVIVLSETTARTLFDTTDALGRIVVFQDSPGRDGSKPRTVQATVVGVVGDIQSSASMGGTGHTMYVPYAQTNAGFIDTVGILVRAEDPAQALTAVRAQVRAIDQELGVVNAGVVIPRWEGALAMLRTLGLLASALGGLALVLAMAGLYGVLSQMVLRRRREIGLRMALGADRQTVLRLVLAQGLRPVLAGLLGGLFVGVTTRAILRSVFHSPWPAIDVFAIVVVPAFFFLAALAACFLPARRAASVDPNVALREL